MSIFSTILGKIFPSANAATTPAANAAGAAGAAAGVAGAVAASVDVEAILTKLASAHPEKLNWQSSIVDLLKLLNLDSSLDSRKKLAGELNYTGDTNDSATMNVWLIKQVMQKLAENGGKVPESFIKP